MPPPLPRRSVWTYCFAHFIQTYQPSPKGWSGRPAHCPFRGLLGVHSRCGLHTRAATNSWHALPKGFNHFVTSIVAPGASGWSFGRVGLSPTGKRRLCTAHAGSGRTNFLAAVIQILLLGAATFGFCRAVRSAKRQVVGVGQQPAVKCHFGLLTVTRPERPLMTTASAFAFIGPNADLMM